MYNQPVADASLTSCPHCDLLQRLPDIVPGESARCLRCGHELWRPRRDSLDRTLATALAAAMVFMIANLVPMMGIRVVGRATSTTVMGGVIQLWGQGMFAVGSLVLFTAIVAPALQIALMLAIALEARRARPRRWVARLLRRTRHTRTWSMVEVMLLGVLVALVKITDYATVVPGVALYMLGVLVVLLSAAQVMFDPHEVWRRVQWTEDAGAGGPPGANPQGALP